MRFVIVAITILASATLAPNGDIFGGKSTGASAGAPLKGFAVSLAPNVSNLRLGSPIIVTVEIRNVSGKIKHAIVGSRAGFFAFRIVDNATNKRIARNAMSTYGADGGGGPLAGRRWEPDRAMFLRFRLDLLYSFKESGTYSIDVSKTVLNVDGVWTTLPPSNVVTLNLQ